MYLGSKGEIATWVPILRYGKDSLQYKWYGKDINYKYIIFLGNTILSRLIQPENAQYPMLVTLSGITIFFKLLQL